MKETPTLKIPEQMVTSSNTLMRLRFYFTTMFKLMGHGDVGVDFSFHPLDETHHYNLETHRINIRLTKNFELLKDFDRALKGNDPLLIFEFFRDTLGYATHEMAHHRERGTGKATHQAEKIQHEKGAEWPAWMLEDDIELENIGGFGWHQKNIRGDMLQQGKKASWAEIAKQVNRRFPKGQSDFEAVTKQIVQEHAQLKPEKGSDSSFGVMPLMLAMNPSNAFVEWILIGFVAVWVARWIWREIKSRRLASAQAESVEKFVASPIPVAPVIDFGLEHADRAVDLSRLTSRQALSLERALKHRLIQRSNIDWRSMQDLLRPLFVNNDIEPLLNQWGDKNILLSVTNRNRAQINALVAQIKARGFKNKVILVDADFISDQQGRDVVSLRGLERQLARFSKADRDNLMVVFPENTIFDSTGLRLNGRYRLAEVEIRLFNELFMSTSLSAIPLMMLDRTARLFASQA